MIDNIQSPHVASLPLPDVDLDKNARLHFCCRNDGSWFDQIYLPSSGPFVLFEKGYECQEVKGDNFCFFLNMYWSKMLTETKCLNLLHVIFCCRYDDVE